MSAEQGPGVPEPDDFDRQLRELTSGTAKAARFTELSAAERARQAARRSPAQRPRPSGWRTARKAKKPRKPAGESRRPGSPQSRPGSGKAPQRRSPRRQRLIMVAKTLITLIAFAALVYLLHLIGLGPQ